MLINVAIPGDRNVIKKEAEKDFNVSLCIFQRNNCQTPTHVPHIQQYISLEC